MVPWGPAIGRLAGEPRRLLLEQDLRGWDLRRCHGQWQAILVSVSRGFSGQGSDVLFGPVLKEPGFSATSSLTPSCLPQPWWLEGADRKPRD